MTTLTFERKSGKSTLPVENPVATALDILKKDGWARGAFICTGAGDGRGKPGSHCAVGAVRAALGIDPDDRDQVPLLWEKRPVEITEANKYRVQVGSFEYVVLKSKATPKKLQKRYRDALLFLADAIDSDWEEILWRETYEWNHFRASTDGVKSLKDVRRKVPLAVLEDIVIVYNDENLDLGDKGRKRIMRRFVKAAQAWDALQGSTS